MWQSRINCSRELEIYRPNQFSWKIRVLKWRSCQRQSWRYKRWEKGKTVEKKKKIFKQTGSLNWRNFKQRKMKESIKQKENMNWNSWNSKPNYKIQTPLLRHQLRVRNLIKLMTHFDGVSDINIYLALFEITKC